MRVITLCKQGWRGGCVRLRWFHRPLHRYDDTQYDYLEGVAVNVPRELTPSPNSRQARVRQPAQNTGGRWAESACTCQHPVLDRDDAQ